MTVELLLAAKSCSECLTSRNRIVSGRRAAELIRQCRENGTHFQCHKGSIADLNVHCRGVHDRIGSQAFQIAERFGITIREVDPDSLGESDEPPREDAASDR